MKPILLMLAAVVFSQTSFFDPDGYYFPNSRVRIAGNEIKRVCIQTLEYSREGKLDYDHPQFLPPRVDIEWKKGGLARTTRAVIVSRDTLYFKLVLSGGRVLEFAGKFLDKRGQYWNRDDVEAMKTIVLEGVFTCKGNGDSIETRRSKLTFWQGD